MAGFFHGGGGAADTQTLYLLSPGYSDDAGPSTDMALLNSAMAPGGSCLLGIPIQAAAVPFQHSPWTLVPAIPRHGLSFAEPVQEVTVAAAAPSSATAMPVQEAYDFRGSKFLKAVQELLDEVANVGKAEMVDGDEACAEEKKASGEPDEEKVELTVAARQELQVKKAKLLGMLEEVEQRYRQYGEQVKAVAAAFEAAAGAGSARMYTGLALRTISQQFRCLRDAIGGQVRAASRRLGEEEDGRMAPVGCRLRLIDSQLRQRQTVEQLEGSGGWRPQRGLPQRAVAVLRGWLFEHFLHPYPGDADKAMLARQAGLSRSQVSNWFINARVRLWKPMVEEMYLEESKQQEAEDSAAGETDSGSSGRREQDDSTTANAGEKRSLGSFYGDGMELALPGKKPRTDDAEVLMSFADGNSRFADRSYSVFAGAAEEAYSPYGMEHFAPPPQYAANGVSLTLSLPQCESISCRSWPGAAW